MSKLILLCLVGMLLSGCVTPTLISQRHIEVVQGKQIIYVVIKTGNSLLDHSLVCDRYGCDGTLLAHDVISNNGILESVGSAALTTLVPAASALGLVK